LNAKTLTLRMTQKRFARLTKASQRSSQTTPLVSLNLCRIREAMRTTPGVALGIADRV
jgi:hypothetical protein